MLQTQVNYWDLVEKSRHNRVSEAQGFENLDIARKNLAEVGRHNVVSEGLTQTQLNELRRHNEATENLTGQQIAVQRQQIEVQKGQLALGFANLHLDQNRLEETKRTNLANEAIRRTQASASMQQAIASGMQASAAQANANTNRINALNAVRQTDIDNANTKYANRTARMNAITNEKNATLREAELVNAQKQTNIREAEVLPKYMNVFTNLIPALR